MVTMVTLDIGAPEGQARIIAPWGGVRRRGRLPGDLRTG